VLPRKARKLAKLKPAKAEPAKPRALESALRDDLMRMGFMHQSQGDLEMAAEYYIRSLERSPTPEAHTFLGGVLRQMGELDQAIEECKMALEIDPNFGNALADLGSYLVEKRDYRRALPVLKKACRSKQYGSPAVPFFYLSRLYIRQGLLGAATECLQKAIKADDSFKPAKEILADVSTLLN